MSTTSITTISVWVRASRPKTLTAALVPVTVGSALAYTAGYFDLLPALIALICALLIQVGTNFANDYYDFVKGADSGSRIGFERATSSGKIQPKTMLIATIITMSLAFALGLYLVWHAGWIILLIGVLCLLFGIAYTGGPFPLGYNGLGDVFVFLFFGFVAVMTTYYVQALEWSLITIWASLAVGALATNILVVNNLRDSEQDRVAGKRTLGVLLGDRALRLEYSALTMLAFAIPPHYAFAEGFTLHSLLPLLTAPLFLYLNIKVWTIRDKRALNSILEKTAMAMTIFGLLLALGLALNQS